MIAPDVFSDRHSIKKGTVIDRYGVVGSWLNANVGWQGVGYRVCACVQRNPMQTCFRIKKNWSRKVSVN